MKKYKSAAVIVTYNSDKYQLDLTITSLEKQFDYLIIVDNGSVSPSTLNKTNDNYIQIDLGENLGIAAAQNTGIKKALALDVDYILLSDQDTIYPETFFNTQRQFLKGDIACVVPAFQDNISGGNVSKFYFETKWSHKEKPVNSGVFEVSQAIASGMLLNVALLKDSSLIYMDEDLFIDWVDFEWCWRLTNAGFKLLGNAECVISHNLGDYKVQGIKLNLRAPIRHYYITRNCIYLSLYSSSISMPLRVSLFFRTFKYMIGFPLFGTPKISNLKAVIVGFYDGLFKRLGKCKKSLN